MEENSIISELRKMYNIVRGSIQESYYQRMLNDAKPIEITPLSEVLTTEQIAVIRSAVNPKPKECFKNATLLCNCLGKDCKYIEGKMTICGTIPVEHAWNKIGDKYVDITMELALDRNPKEEKYVALGEYDINDVMDVCVEQGYYGNIYQARFIQVNYQTNK